MLADTLKQPISWKNGDAGVQDFLDKLQGNILKGHGRSHTVNLFCRFRDDAKDAARAFLKQQIARTHSAKHQLQAADTRRATGVSDTDPFVSIFLTQAGYDYFGVPADRQPAGAAFRNGMSATAALNDPPKHNWTAALRDPHVLILVALMSFEEAEQEATRLLNEIGEIGDVLHHASGDVIGTQYYNEAGNGIENFGYVDGRSQPLVLTEDIEKEGPSVWPHHPFPVDQFVVRDPAVDDAAAYGSYFVFRQLEQNVAAFKSAEDQINVLRPDPSFHGNADSLSVGRQENGTPMEMQATELPGAVTNNFLFTSDPPKCPHFAHIRKVNPRTADTQKHLMIRRGITYGQRNDRRPDPNDPSKFVLPDETELLPRKGVGLLFQSYQASIEDQFEIAQCVWANTDARADVPAEHVGVDPVIGQPGPATALWPKGYGGPGVAPAINFSTIGKKGKGPYVRLMGGGYFFAPSLPFLQSL